MNIIEFDIWSKFGCFTKPFSNSGGMLTYFIPPKTSIIGMVGAILGYSFDDFNTEDENLRVYRIEELNNIQISIQPLFPLKTKRVTFNRVSQKKIENFHQDILINPYYKVFIRFPDFLKSEEELFLKRLKQHETIYNLYMGKNEFLLNYEVKRVFESEKFDLNNGNSYEFFQNNEVHGSLNRQNIKKAILKSEKANMKRSLFSKRTSKLDSFYEYLITDYPICRKNFVDFNYSPVSFYTLSKDENCFFSSIELKEDKFLELYKIGDKKWISMV